MELPAAKTVPPLLLLTALDGASDLGCLPLSLFSKRLGLAGGQSEAFRERFSLARLKIFFDDVDDEATSTYHSLRQE
jgi:hypothetical protein